MELADAQNLANVVLREVQASTNDGARLLTADASEAGDRKYVKMDDDNQQ